MRAELSPFGKYVDITVVNFPYGQFQPQFLRGLDDHGLRDLEFILAQRRAMSRRCDTEHGEHTCGNAPGHGAPHLCRACTETWEETG